MSLGLKSAVRCVLSAAVLSSAIGAGWAFGQEGGGNPPPKTEAQCVSLNGTETCFGCDAPIGGYGKEHCQTNGNCRTNANGGCTCDGSNVHDKDCANYP